MTLEPEDLAGGDARGAGEGGEQDGIGVDAEATLVAICVVVELAGVLVVEEVRLWGLLLQVGCLCDYPWSWCLVQLWLY